MAPTRLLLAWLDAQFPALRSRDYALLFANSMCSAGANWALLLGRGWLVFSLTHSSTAVGIVTFAGMAPFLFAAPLAGALADRIDRRRLALIAVAIGLGGTLGLVAVTALGIVQVWHVVLFAFVGGIARAAQTPAEQAMLPNLVPAAHLLNAVALSNISQHGSRMAGPVFGGLLLAALGPGAVFVLASAFFAASLAALWAIRYRSGRNEGVSMASLRRLAGEMAEGANYIGADRRVALIIMLVVFHCALTMGFDSLMPQLAASVGGGPRTYSAILFGLGFGAVCGTLGVARLHSEQAQGRALLVTGIGSGVSMAFLGLGQTPVAVVLGAMLAGGTQASFMALTASHAQLLVRDDIRGRVMSIYVMLAAGHMAFVNLGVGAAEHLIGLRILLVVPGLIWLLVLAGALVALGDVRRLMWRGRFAAVAAA